MQVQTTSVMGLRISRRIIIILLILLIGISLGFEFGNNKNQIPDFSAIQGNAQRGATVIHMAGCIGCHTQSENEELYLAGGRQLETPFGIFVSPNITNDSETGIGGWTLFNLWNALTNGVSPDGRHYYPAFPYTSYTKMSLQDIADLKAYLDTVPSVQNAVGDHHVPFPFSVRAGLNLWKFLFFIPGQLNVDQDQSNEWNRGRYLVNGPGHCGECHTSRNLLGGASGELLAGGAVGISGDRVPALRGDADNALSNWSIDDIVFALEMGIKPDGDTFGSKMADVVDYGTSHLSTEDLTAIAVYLKSL